MSATIIRRAAVRYVRNGWPLAPGTWWATRRRTDGRYVCPVMGCRITALHPANHEAGILSVELDAAKGALAEPDEVEQLWDRPYTMLVPTGDVVDVVQIPQRALTTLPPRSLGAPIAELDDGGLKSWLVFAAAGDPVAPSEPIRQVPGVIVHQEHSWVPVPPSPIAGEVKWHRPPAAYRWDLPALNVVIAALENRLTRGPRHLEVPAPRGRLGVRRVPRRRSAPRAT